MDHKTAKKIKTLNSLADIVANFKKRGKKIVQCHGVFDVVHLGHIRHFNLAKKEGDVLVVTITRDEHVKRGPGRPIFNEHLRAETLASLAVTDFVAIAGSSTATDSIKLLKPDVYVKGAEYSRRTDDVTGKIYEEEEAVKSVGGRMAFTDDITFSSSKLISDYLEPYPPRTLKYLKALGKRYTIGSVTDSLNSLRNMKTLVIGDAIIDQYHYCSPMGKSSKEHLIANRYISEESFTGGSLATANNVGSVCNHVDLVTLIRENDPVENFIRERLMPNVHPIFFRSLNAETVVKRRFVNEGTNRKLFEICHIGDNTIERDIETEIGQYLEKVLKGYDLIVVSDFGHGLLSKKLIKLICRKAKYLAVNVQTNSANIGFNLVTKYPRANCVCIDEMELRFATHDKVSNLRTLAKRIYDQLGCGHIIATRGPHGSLSYSRSDGFHESPALSYQVIDAIGAGDAFFSFVAPCFAKGLPQDLVSFIGNAVGSLAVRIVCNREPVSYVDLVKFITRLLK
ncbi:MAG: PfkB family carbohydrate kinase [Candidatus Omnitrophota bacterium]